MRFEHGTAGVSLGASRCPTDHLGHVVFEASCADAVMRLINGSVRIQDRVVHNPINEVVNYGSNRIDAAETLVERGLAGYGTHCSTSRFLRGRPTSRKFNYVAPPDRSLNQDGAVNSGFVVVALIDRSEKVLGGLGRRGIERDHLAARVALKNRAHPLRSNPKSWADVRMLGKAASRPEIHVDVCPEPPLIDGASDLVAKPMPGLNRKQRNWTTIRHRALGSQQS